MTALVWIRADLRLHDHPALAAGLAHQKCRVVFIKTPDSWSAHDDAPCKIDFILSAVERLKFVLKSQGVDCDILECAHYHEVADLLAGYCQKWSIAQLYFNQQYEFNERVRDVQVMERLKSLGISAQTFHEQLLVQPGLVLSAKNMPLKVFTAFKNKWWQVITQQANLAETNLPLVWDQENPAFGVLDNFLEQHLAHYHLERDFPNLEGTSQLSPYLAQGVISIRRIFHCLNAQPDSEGKRIWQNELVWREFFKHIMFLFPQVCQHRAFNTDQDGPWQNDQKFFKAWSEGQTGFPIIDAAMRQLNQTGWMHNRLRMNVAMFLTKLLGVDWRWGECYFMQHLVDGDLAANNGGWQWAAGTGCDAAPYFRIFNPLLQSEKFDPKGEFIRRYCPELSHFDDKAIHAPHERNPLLALESNYPRPIIDYAVARRQALDRRKTKLN